jgi:hypothetical protein
MLESVKLWFRDRFFSSDKGLKEVVQDYLKVQDSNSCFYRRTDRQVDPVQCKKGQFCRKTV